MLTQMLLINWSVWDSNPIVSWTWDKGESSVRMARPPLAVAHIKSLGVVAIVGDYLELGSDNLRFHAYDGTLMRTYTAPPIGEQAQFIAISERTTDYLVATIGFRLDETWMERAGDFNSHSGEIEGLHRSY